MTTRTVERLWREDLPQSLAPDEVLRTAEMLDISLLGWYRPGRLTIGVRDVARAGDDVALLRMRGRPESGVWIEMTSSMPRRRGFLLLRAEVLQATFTLSDERNRHGRLDVTPVLDRRDVALLREVPELAGQLLRLGSRLVRGRDFDRSVLSRVEELEFRLRRILDANDLTLLAAQRPWSVDLSSIELTWSRADLVRSGLVGRLPELDPPLPMRRRLPAGRYDFLSTVLSDALRQVQADRRGRGFLPEPRWAKKRRRMDSLSSLGMLLAGYELLSRAVLEDDPDFAIAGGFAVRIVSDFFLLRH